MLAPNFKISGQSVLLSIKQGQHYRCNPDLTLTVKSLKISIEASREIIESPYVRANVTLSKHMHKDHSFPYAHHAHVSHGFDNIQSSILHDSPMTVLYYPPSVDKGILTFPYLNEFDTDNERQILMLHYLLAN